MPMWGAIVFCWVSVCSGYTMCRTPIFDHVVAFADRVFSVAQSRNTSANERLGKYERAVEDLLDSASADYGSSWDTAGLRQAAWDYVRHEEQNRAPAPGWDAGDGPGNILLFDRMARQGRVAYRRLMSFAWEQCPTPDRQRE